METPDDDDPEYDEGREKADHGTTHNELETKGEKSVRIALAKGEYGAPGNKTYVYVMSWLDVKRNFREAETSRLTRRANLIAWIAIIIAIASIIKDIVILLFSKN